MIARDLLPALLIGLAFSVAVGAVRVLPFGEATVVVRVPAADPLAGLRAAAMADAALVALPAPGLAVLHGDAARIRRAIGWALTWDGAAPCSTR